LKTPAANSKSLTEIQASRLSLFALSPSTAATIATLYYGVVA